LSVVVLAAAVGARSAPCHLPGLDLEIETVDGMHPAQKLSATWWSVKAPASRLGPAEHRAAASFRPAARIWRAAALEAERAVLEIEGGSANAAGAMASTMTSSSQA